MAFCARFDTRSSYLYDIDEIIIPFHGSDEKLQKLPEFLEDHINQRVIVDITDEWRPFYGTIFTPITEKYHNIAIRLAESATDIPEVIKNLGIPAFFNKPASNWEQLYLLLSQPVSDVYITGQLGFELDKVAAAAAKKGCRVRVYPNVAQSAILSTPALYQFFIRPEDVDLYNRRYVSTFEFYIPDDLDLNWDVLYRAYAIRKKWPGPLEEIIQGLDSDINGRFISPYWGEYRITCGRNCLKFGSCKMCDVIYDLSNSLAELGVAPVIPKDTKAIAKAVMEKIDSKKIDAEEPLPPPVVPNF